MRQTRLLALAALLPAWAAPGLAADPSASATRLEINAEGKATQQPDLATVSAGMTSEAPTAAAAIAETARRTAAARRALAEAGVAERDVQTSALSLMPVYRHAEGKAPVVTGYRASHQLSVRFRDIARAGSVIDALVARGANEISGPSYGIDRPEALLDRARLAALADARARADLYARAAGLKVRRIVSIREEGAAPPPMPMPLYRAMADQAAETSLAPGEQALVVRLAVSFDLE